MRKALFLLLFPLSLPAFSQRITGKITDTAGNPVEYVNVGVENSQTGIISDENGRFSLVIPESLDSANLYVSHISYETKLIPLAELRQHGNTPFAIQLNVRAFDIPEILVRAGRPRYRRVDATRISMIYPGFWTVYKNEQSIPSEIGETASVSDFLRESGTILSIKNSMTIEKLNFHINSASDSLLVRINVYALSDSVFTPLHVRPFYVMITPTRRGESYEVDLSEGVIVAPVGKIVVGIQQIRAYGDITVIGVPVRRGEAYHRTASSYTSFTQDNIFGSENIYIDMSVFGRLLPQ